MESIGEVITLSGDVRALSSGAERILNQGDAIHEGETIVTGHGAQVQIRLADESVLAQGEDASQTIDTFIYDPANASGSNMLINMAQGTFRMVTGKVGQANPEGVAVKTPLATIGIRGTGIDMDVRGALAKIGCFLYDGLDVTITSEQGTRILNAVNTILDILADGTFGEIRTYSDFEKAFFKAAAPILGIPEDQLYGGDQAGDDTGNDEGNDDGEQPQNTPEAELAQLFVELFGTPEQPTDLLQELFQALTGLGEDSLQGGSEGDTLVAGGDDDDDDDTTGTGTTTQTSTSTSWTGDEDGSTFDTSGADRESGHTYDGTSQGDYLNDFSDSVLNEVLRGYDGNDTLSATTGADTLFGGAGNDSLSGGDGNDLLIGGTGDDELHGEVGNDEMYGGSGSDFLDGGAGADTLDGGTDSDILYGGLGTDQITGGAGDDYYLAYVPNGNDLNLGDEYKDFASGDLLVIDRAQTNWSEGTSVSPGTNFFTTTQTHDQYVANNGDWTDVSYTTGNYPLILDGNGNLYYDENPDGGGDTAEYIGHFSGTTPGENTIKVASIQIDGSSSQLMTGTTGYDFLVGLAGDDTLYGSGGADTLYGGLGADAFKYTATTDGSDKIVDFHSGEDYFLFKDTVFVCTSTDSSGSDTIPGSGSFFTVSGAYEAGAAGVATSGKGFVFDGNNDLWYDSDFSDNSTGTYIGNVEGTVVASDIHLVSL